MSKMKVTFPHMGNMSIAIKGLLTDLGLEVVPPPPITKKPLLWACGIRRSLPVFP